jgi:hypothetical protein
VVIHKVLLINKEKSNKKENIVVTVININSLNANLKDAPFNIVSLLNFKYNFIMKKIKPKTYTKNDGWENIDYNLIEESDENKKLSHVLNEACHVFYHHATGRWEEDKLFFVNEIIPFIKKHPSLIKKLLATKDRVIKMITYKAVEIIEQDNTNQIKIHQP